jgi:hypothetical protein
MKKIFFLILILPVFCACNKLDIAKGTPDCVEDHIRNFNKNAVCDDATVKEYTFQGIDVYVYDPGTCGADMSSAVTDSGCNTLGYLGGFTGNTKINGEEFSNAVFVRTIWEK